MPPSPSDHRVRVTRMLIRRAFTQLLGQKPIESITVKELCAQAGIHRGTFYAHYTDLYHLRDQLEGELMEEFEKAMAPLLDRHQCPTPADVTADVVRCLRENADLCAMVLSQYGNQAFLLRLLAVGWDRCRAYYDRVSLRATPREMEFFYAFVSAGFVGMLRRWLSGGSPDGDRELALMAQRLMDHCVKALEAP